MVRFTQHSRLCGVVGVDVDVLGGQVCRPEDAGSGALVEMDGNGEFFLAQVGVGGRFVELGGAASVTADAQFAEPDVDARGVDLGAGVADGGHQASPVGVAS